MNHAPVLIVYARPQSSPHGPYSLPRLPLPRLPSPRAPPPAPLAMEIPLDVRVRWLEERVRKLEIRTLLLAVIGIQTALTLFLLMIIIKLVT